MKKFIFMLWATLLLMAGCGGGGGTLSGSSSSSSSSNTGVASIQLLASSTQLPSDDSNPVTISALALNANNQAIADVAMVIGTNSGYLNNQKTTTQSNGIATAELHVGDDKSNRTITVTATSGTATASLAITVSGTKLSIQGPAAVTSGTSQTFTVNLVDAGGKGIANQNVTITSSKGNTLEGASTVTDSSGNARVKLTGSVGGVDTLTATALGLTAVQSVTVSGDSFTFSSPAANEEIAINATKPVTVTWVSNGNAQAGQTITFAATRGTIPSTAVTNGSGVATVNLSSTTAGPAVISATTSTGVSAQIEVLFVATTPASMSLQASPNSIGPSEKSTLTAVVLDANGNLVKNKTVQFNLSDNTQGTLDKATAVTDSEGRAQATYTASNTTSGSNKITITATVQGSSVTATSTLTVGGRALFISLGTGNKIKRLPDDNKPVQYDVPYVVQVTDANGKGVAGQTLTMSVLTDYYGTGSMAFLGGSYSPAVQVGVDTNGDPVYQAGYTDFCPDEDTILGAGNPGYRNGSLDVGEDFYQNDGILEAGNIATVTPKTVTTDSNGFAYIDVIYPMDYAYWVYVHLTAATSVAGTESSRTVSFTLPGAADDYNTQGSAPPGFVSPFGTRDWSCP